jgi:regulator of sirC expression with transglutaminase-like and TPR domain
VSARANLEAALRRVGEQKSAAIDLAGTALLLAGLDRPHATLDPYRDHLSALAQEVAQTRRAAGGLKDRIDALHEVIFTLYGYRGDTEGYEDTDNADLTRVIDRRLGLPVSIGIIIIHTARAQGWPAMGLGFPGHFLVRIDYERERAILDPFDITRPVETHTLRDLLKSLMGADAELTPDMYNPVSNRAILVRLQNNLKTRALQDDDHRRAVTILERMVMFAPNQTKLWEELGLLRAREGKIKSAITALEEIMSRSQIPGERERASEMLARLRTSLN